MTTRSLASSSSTTSVGEPIAYSASSRSSDAQAASLALSSRAPSAGTHESG